MENCCKCKDILNWKNPKITIAALIVANILYFLFRNINICNENEENCEEELKNYIINLNKKLNKIIELDDIPNLIYICLLCIIISSYLENFKSITILIIFFDIYVLLQNETIKKQKEKYSKMLSDLINKNLLEKIPKYKEEKLE